VFVIFSSSTMWQYVIMMVLKMVNTYERRMKKLSYLL